jgi:hypothetical protein
MNKAGLPLDETLGDEGKSHVRQIDHVLSQARFVPVHNEFREWKKRNGRRPAWYSPLGVTDLRNMATNINKEPLYVFVYGPGSDVMHVWNYGQHIRIHGERITFYSIRHPKEFPTTVRLTATIAIDLFMKILQEYREGEKARFGQKYVEKWRQAFMNIPELKIEERDLASPHD